MKEKHTQHQHFTYLNVAILGIVGSHAAVLAVERHGVAFARLQQQLRPERGVYHYTTGWAEGVQLATQCRSLGSTAFCDICTASGVQRLEIAPAQCGQCYHHQPPTQMHAYVLDGIAHRTVQETNRTG